MYRLLEVGEVIENGDEYFDSYEWKSFKHLIGLPIKGSTLPTRRLVKPAVTPAVTPAASSVPDPGEGWRLLKEGEKIERDDQFWHDRGKEWLIGSAIWIGDPFDDTFQPMRRRVAQPAPVVSVGDRVKVLSGPWAGCTGVVLSWSVEIAITGGEMKARTDSQPIVRLDHVWVGGQRLGLTLKTSDVEKLPPVVPEVLFRDLSHGETVRAGDQFWKFGFGPWTVAGPDEVGDTITTYKARHRRPVRVQSPGWRYLDAGETVQAGDEASYSGTPNPWRPCSWCLNKPVSVSHDKYFRRKLPANQGG